MIHLYVTLANEFYKNCLKSIPDIKKNIRFCPFQAKMF